MEVKAIMRMARISAFKARELTRHIQGLPVGEAVDVLRFSTQKAARLVGKTLDSAIANAENNNGLSAETLFVKEAVVGEGPTFKRFQPKARGSAGPIRKRTSHIRIIVAQRAEEKVSKKKAATKPKKATAKNDGESKTE